MAGHPLLSAGLAALAGTAQEEHLLLLQITQLLDCCWTYIHAGSYLYTFGLRMCSYSTTPS